MKYLLPIVVFLHFALFSTTVFAAACVAPQVPSPDTGECYTPVNSLPGPGTPATYELMAPLTGDLGPGSKVNLTQYLSGVVQVAIGLAGLLAVIMIVICGIKLMGTPSASAKSEAKECVWNAIFGVLLAIGAWVLLYTINPLLLSNSAELASMVTTAPTPVPKGPVEDPMPTAPGWYFKYTDEKGTHYSTRSSSAEVCAQLIEPAKKAGKTVVPVDGRMCFEVLKKDTQMNQDEASVRTALCGNTSCVGSMPIGINRGPCVPPGADGVINKCTNVAGLPSSAVDFIKGLQSACGCNVLITGGTENGHATHAAGKPIFDLHLREGDAATNYILKNGTGKRATFGPRGVYRVFLNNFWLTHEGNHWHICELDQKYWFCTNYMTKEDYIKKDEKKLVPPN